MRVPDLRTFRDALATLACDGDSVDARDRLVIVPTRSAAAHLTRGIEARRLREGGAVVLPDLITRDDLHARLALRLPPGPRALTPAEREVLLGVACRAAADSGTPPPFQLRPGLIAEILRFYDALQRHQKDVATFERLALGALEPGADHDRGAERLVRQTRFLAAAFRAFEQACLAAGGADEHTLRVRLLSSTPERPWTHVVVAVLDRARDAHGLWPADWDLLARLPGLARLDVVVTDTALAGAFHQQIHQILPGIEEVRPCDDVPRVEPALLVPAREGAAHVLRDREEEVASFARWVREIAREGGPADAEERRADLGRMALVVRQPLPYLYVGREVLRAAGVPSQMFDALPLAGEPYAAALDLVFSAVSTNFARTPLIALLRSPHFDFVGDGPVVSSRDISALDRAMSDAQYLGELASLRALVGTWRDKGGSRGAAAARAAAAADLALEAGRMLEPLRASAPVAAHLSALLAFLRRFDRLPGPDDPLRVRQLRARSAIVAIIEGLRDAYARFDGSGVEFDAVAALVRRWIEAQTFAPRRGNSGVHVVDAESARFGDFDVVQIAGLVDGEWPERPRRNIFYSPALLRDLGWPAESERLEGARAAFVDLLRLASSRVLVSAFMLEDDSVVALSTFADEVERCGLDAVEYVPPRARVFDYEALGIEPVHTAMLPPHIEPWVGFRYAQPAPDDRFRGATHGHTAAAYSLSALERYQDCPFKYFASDVLRLQEIPEDEPSLSPRARGRLVHEIFQQFFEAWDARGLGTITSATLDDARALFVEVSGPLLDRLPAADVVLERARLFGTAISVGIVDVVLGLEASRPTHVQSRLLEYRLEGSFNLGMPDARTVPLKGVADRIDLLEGRRLRVIDYKTGSAPNVKRALQVPIYALCAQERLSERDGMPWAVDDAAYVAFSGKRALVPVLKPGGADAGRVLGEARDRLVAALDGIAGGDFPPRPQDTIICGWCDYASVCRKDYVGDE